MLLLIEFNDSAVHVAPLSGPIDDYGTRQLIEGVSVLSAPFSAGSKEDTHRDFNERIALATVARASCLQIYVEKIGAPTVPFLQRPILDRLAIGPDKGCRFGAADEQRSLLVFEKLENITNVNDIEISANGLGE